MKKSLPLCCLLLLIPILTFSQPTLLPGVAVTSARTEALGGYHTAYVDGFTTLTANPAGLKSVKKSLSIAEITAGLSGPIFDISSIIISGLGGSDILSIIGSADVQKLLKTLYAGMNLVGPIHFGYIGEGIGFGLFNTTTALFRNIGGINLEAKLGEQAKICGGYAFTVPLPETLDMGLDVGVLLKTFVRGELVIRKSIFELAALFQNPGADILMKAPFSLSTGFGFDIGIRYSLSNWFAAGLVVRDAFSPVIINDYATFQNFVDNAETPVISNGLVPLDLSAGVLFSPNLGDFERFINSLNIMLDYSDILDFLTHPATARNPVLHVGLGIDVQLLRILHVRGGFFQGLFSAGLGIDLTFFTLNAAMYGREVSAEPGIQPIYNIILGLEFRI